MITIYTWDSESGFTLHEFSGVASVNQKTYRQNAILVGIDYVKGDEAVLKLYADFKYVDVPKSFRFSKLDNSYVKPFEMFVDETCSRLVPIPVPKSVDFITLNVEFIDSNGSEGSLEIWLKPDYFDF